MIYPDDFINKVIQDDCLEVMPSIPDKSIDVILCDLPYGTTACKWDTIIPFEPLWEQYKRIIKDNGAIVLTASQPFTSALVMSNISNYRHQWIWDKKQAGNPFLAKTAPLKTFEDVLVFSKKRVRYFPQMRQGVMRKKGDVKVDNQITGTKVNGYQTINDKYYPSGIIEFSTAGMRGDGLHPTQKPVALFEYLIKTYTNEGDLVLDNCAGSGTTGVACKRLNRRFILIEQEEKYCEIAKNRILSEPEPLF
jgi:site-specific DNA-methyltransferase (adenine-specific)